MEANSRTVPEEGSVSTLVELVARSAARFPGRIAAEDASGSITYAELERLSAILANHLARLGVTRGDRVALDLRRTVQLPVAVLAVLKAGAAYLCLDSRDPQLRRSQMIARAEVGLVLQSPQSPDVRPPGSLCPSVVLDLTDLAAATESGPIRPGAVLVPPRPEDVAALIFTSGSTGEPKAVQLTQAGLTWFSTNSDLPRLEPGDRVGQISSPSFDAFHYEMWHAFASGACLVFLPHLPQMLASGVRQVIQEQRVTATLVPTMAFNHIVQADPEAFTGVRALGVGGDVLSVPAVRRLFSGRFDGVLYNLYGPAEITTACTVHAVTAKDLDRTGIPIGLPLEGVEIQLIDDEGNPVPEGLPGEALVSGPGVSPGYFGDPDGTRERFRDEWAGESLRRTYRTGDVMRWHAGVLEFSGRTDTAVKVQGHRVDTLEVERILGDHPGVVDVAVVVDASAVHPRLCAALVLSGATTSDEVREVARARLPEYLIPTVFLAVNQIPANRNGKRDLDEISQWFDVDRERASRSAGETTGTEQELIGIWADLLRVEQIDSSDDFFLLGGNSVLLFRMKKVVQETMRADLSFRMLLAGSTLREVATLIDQARSS